MVKEKFLYEVATCKDLQGNDIRFLLACLGRNVYPKEAAEILGWRKQNVSNIARKLKDLGLITVNEYPVYYRTNEDWVNSELNGQLELKY